MDTICTTEKYDIISQEGCAFHNHGLEILKSNRQKGPKMNVVSFRRKEYLTSERFWR
jgi:hypothetical protein